MSSLESAHRACELGECQARVHLHLISSDHRSTAYQLVRGTCERGERGPREITQDASVPSMLRRDGGTKPVKNIHVCAVGAYIPDTAVSPELRRIEPGHSDTHGTVDGAHDVAHGHIDGHTHDSLTQSW